MNIKVGGSIIHIDLAFHFLWKLIDFFQAVLDGARDGNNVRLVFEENEI